MKLKIFMALIAMAVPLACFGLSRPIGRDIAFPKDFDAKKAEVIRRIIQKRDYNFVGGIVSMWQPDFGTRLSFEGDSASLNKFIADLRALKGISMRLILYKGRHDEGRQDTSWQLDYSQARPDQLTIYLNLNSPNLDFYQIKLPEWPAPNQNSSSKKED